MRKISSIVMGTLVAGMLAFVAAPVMAGEHGGTTVKEHGGSAVEGSHSEGSHGMEMSDEVATLMQAAKELKATNPKLSKKLEDLAKKHEM